VKGSRQRSRGCAAALFRVRRSSGHYVVLAAGAALDGSLFAAEPLEDAESPLLEVEAAVLALLSLPDESALASDLASIESAAALFELVLDL
jgi:hypothetical protein